MKRLFLLFALGFYISAGKAAGFDASRAWGHLLAQCAFGPRVPGSEAHEKCLTYLENELSKCAQEVRRQTFWAEDPVSGETHRLTNVIARFWPERSHHVLLCAHWDSRPWADQDPDPANHMKPILGANDGASGVAVLLEIARCISLEDPGVGVEIVFFDGEDGGREGRLEEYLLGSKEYAKTLTLPLSQAAILLDMVGDADLHIPQEYYSQTSAPSLVKEVFNLAQSLGERAFDQNPGNAVFDDHIPLLQAGIPALDPVDFDYAFWHTVQDTPDHCSPESLGSVGRVVLAWIYFRGSGD